MLNTEAGVEALYECFKSRAEAVSAVVVRVGEMNQALRYAVDLCVRKEACQLLAAGCGEPLSGTAQGLCGQKPSKTMAAPNMPSADRDAFAALCREAGIMLTDRPLREHLAGIDIGLTMADYGIAETGTLVINSSSEAVRLATMISEIHVAVLPVARLRADVFALEAELAAMMGTPRNYLAFITGASRTADIERVLAIGVHGPLELHIVLLEEA